MADEANCKYDEQARRWTDGWDMKAGAYQPSRHTVWELACAELCGWGHYKMQGKLFVHDTKEDFLKWLRAAEQAQSATQPAQPETTAPQ
jgi:heme/copper-type cytochrome/quinol oxidase subunit 2